MFLVDGATYPGMAPEFAQRAAYGDLLAAVLAVLAIPAVVTGSAAARFLVLLFNVEGTADLIDAIVLANVYQVEPQMGPAYWIPAFWFRRYWSRTTSPSEFCGSTGRRRTGDWRRDEQRHPQG
jgi:hypothetical protein